MTSLPRSSSGNPVLGALRQCAGALCREVPRVIQRVARRRSCDCVGRGVPPSATPAGVDVGHRAGLSRGTVRIWSCLRLPGPWVAVRAP